MTGLLADALYLAHENPAGHVERPERMRVLLEFAAELRRDPRVVSIDPRAATREELEAVHSPEHVARVAATAGRAHTMLDSDTFTSPRSDEVARAAAGGCVALVEAIADGRLANGIALVRPPGHHAERDRAMGFCLYNNAVVAAAALRARGLSRVAIVDWDVHHGNGTQEIFEEDASVFFASLHQYPFDPGTGAAHETGRGAGRGCTLNVPMTAGDGDDEWLAALGERVLPALRAFAPEFLLVSAGFDAHVRDPLGGMRLTESGFASMTRALLQCAAECCSGRFAAILEGGYDPSALRESVRAVALELLGA